MPDAPPPKTSAILLSDSPLTSDDNVYTRSQNELKGLLTQDYPVCISVVGPPGTGKTSLMSMACYGSLSPDRSRILGFIASVPPSADSTEIARQLVLNLCTALLGERVGPRLRGVSNGFTGKAVLISSVAAVAGSILLGLSAKGIRINSQMGLGWALVLAGVIGILSSFVARVGRFKGSGSLQRSAKDFFRGGRASRPRKLYKRAAELADTLEAERRFETTITSGWTAGLTPLTGLQFGSSGSVSKKLLPTPLSDLAQGFAQLVADVAAETPLLIGIDGLDKCGPGADIDQLLFELRPFLRTRGCRYLIALSEGTEPRSSFRSSPINAVVRCELLTFDDARSLVGHRVVGLPDAFAALCFTTSGGLPGDMLRTTRFVVDRTISQPNLSVGSACNAIVKEELRTLSEELRWAARTPLSWTHQQRLFDWAERLSSSSPKADDLLAVADEIRALAINQSSEASYTSSGLQRVTHRAAALSYFYVTLIDFFTDSLDAEALGRALAPNAASASLDRLAEARRLIELATCGAAWMDVSAFRAEWGMLIPPAADSSADPSQIA